MQTYIKTLGLNYKPILATKIGPGIGVLLLKDKSADDCEVRIFGGLLANTSEHHAKAASALRAFYWMLKQARVEEG